MTGVAADHLSVVLSGETILADVSLAFAPREVTAIVGPNGADKSTLLACLAGLRRPDRGGVALDGRPMRELKPREKGQAHQLDVLGLLRSLSGEGCGVIVTLHDLGLAARVAGRVVVLHRGRVVADGPPAQALTADLLTRVYGGEARVTARGSGLDIELMGRSPG